MTRKRGTLLTVPDGSAESFTNVIEWIGCNLEFAPAQWANARQRADSLEIRAVPWVRLCHTNAGETWEDLKTKLALLVTTAQLWGSDTIICNYEIEAEVFGPADVNNHLRNVLNWDGKTGWSTLAWLQNAVNWAPIADDPVLLQIFPKDNGWPYSREVIGQRMGDCVQHARQMGFTYVGVTYQTYDDIPPTAFDTGSYMHSTFPGNVIAHGKWGEWYV